MYNGIQCILLWFVDEYVGHDTPIASCKGIQDSLGFWIPRRRIPDSRYLSLCQWNLDSGFQSLVGFRIPCAVFRIPKPRISDPTSKTFPDSDPSSKNFTDSGIRIPFHGATPIRFCAINRMAQKVSVTGYHPSCR